MEKIVILGSSGAGKSTLARILGSLLGIKVFHLDRLLWLPDWKGKTEYERMEILEKLAFGGRRWIIEGNYLRSSQIHLDMADTIIFLDISPFACFLHLIKRHREYYKCPRYDIPKQCTDKLTLRRVWKTLTFPFHGRKMIKQVLSNYGPKRIVRFHSTKDVGDYLAQLEQSMNDKRYSSSAILTKERILAARRYPEVTPLLSGRYGKANNIAELIVFLNKTA